MTLANIHVPAECRRMGTILARIGDKWTILIVSQLGEGPKRFSELRKAIGSISQRMLTLTLRGLERDGIVRRTVHASVPPRVDYELTHLGHELLTPVAALSDWARRHAMQIDRAREAFDANHTRAS